MISDLARQEAALQKERAVTIKALSATPKHAEPIETDPAIVAIDAKITEDSDRADRIRAEVSHRSELVKLRQEFDQASKDGVQVQIQSVAHYRGANNVQLQGIGLVTGLEGTGDSTQSVVTQNILANWWKAQGLSVPPTTITAKNVALVQVTAVMPAFTKPGSEIDVTVSSISDAKSLQGGKLELTMLYSASDPKTVVATATGGLSIGGFNASANGSSTQKNHVNVGIIPRGAEVQQRVESQVVYKDGGVNKVYLDLDESNPTTIKRIVDALRTSHPELRAVSTDWTTVALTVPDSMTPEDVMSAVNLTEVYADTPAKVVINERTGTIVVGGNVTIGPAMVACGNLNVRIQTVNDVSQPEAFSNGETTRVANSSVHADQDPATIALIRPTTSVWDLAKIFQALDLKPIDVIKILEELHKQGALKARIELE
jgi:flagellar P-ring protein precursor FlgI